MVNKIDSQLYKQLCNVEDIELELKKYREYDILYNFSTARKNLYDWFEFYKKTKLLEIGCECGALTGFFASKVESVVAIEADKEKFEICDYRYKDFENIKVVNNDLDSFESKERFDYIVMTGTLEEAGIYLSGKNPSERLLKKAKSLLSADGLMFVAVSNRMGLAYLGGEVDPKVGKVFKGFSSKNGLFGRKQILNIFEKSELEIIDTYYPMPDYRFTSVLYSDDYLPLVGDFHAGNVSFSENSYKIFDETSVADLLIESGEFVDYANSFLFLLR